LDAVDGKAADYLSVLTLLVGAAGFFLKWVADTLIPPRQPLQWFLCLAALAVMIAVLTAWWHVFGALRTHRIKSLPLNDEMIRFFDEHGEVDIYYALANRYKEAWAENQIVNDSKLRDLALGYRAIILSVMLLLAFAALYTLYAWRG
jgi:hypothetical protein